jgi:SAM-dependent methyltransferase
VDQILFDQFSRVERAHWWFKARRQLVLELASHYIPAGEAVLDIGCGSGYFLEALQTRYQTWGVDPSPTAIELCRDRGVDRVLLGSAYDLPAVGRDRFAAAFLLDVLEHLDDDRLALKGVRDILAPEGVVIVSVPAYQSLWSHHDVVNQHRRRYTKPRLLKALQETGFEVVRASYFNTRLFPPAALSRLVFRALGWDPHLQLKVPPAWLNLLLQRIFEGERHRIAGPRTRHPYPFGLSILAVGRKHEP